MKNLALILSALFLISCGDAEVKENKVKKTESVVENIVEKTGSEFSNPAIIYGTDFGNFFRTLYRQGRFEDMIKFTSKESLDLHGKENVSNFYKNEFEFGYEIGKAMSKTEEGEYTTLNYDANIIATKTVIRITVKVENDSCKIVLPNELKEFLK